MEVLCEQTLMVLTPPQPGKFPTCCHGAAAVVWGKSLMAQSPEMLQSCSQLSSSLLAKADVRECCQERSTCSSGLPSSSRAAIELYSTHYLSST